MKTTTTQWLKGILFVLICLMPAVGRTQEATTSDLIGKLERLGNLTEKQRADLVRTNYSNLSRIRETLMAKFDSGDENEKSYAAYLLGEYRFSKATKTLAKNISWEDKVRPNTERGSEWFWDHYPAMEALIKIGTPSLPAVIRNLAESDDAKVRELSFMVLNRIEGDRDIVQLRLQKALKAENEPQKKTRLQAALKTSRELNNPAK